MRHKLLLITILSICSLSDLAAQDSLDFLRSTGKIYAVVAGIVVMFIVIVFYLIRLDRKISKLEKNQ